MSIEIVYTCPLGSKCEEAKDGKIYRCRWFVKLQGHDPQTSEPVDEFRCSMEWAPVLHVEAAGFQRHTNAAVESLRNDIVRGIQKTAPKIIKQDQKVIESDD